MTARHPPASLALVAALGLFALVLLPRLSSHGMFVDGVHYAAVSRNLALGIGTAWNPRYTDTYLRREVEHPPLAFWLQSLAFRIFGDSAMVESLWGAVAASLALVLLLLLWRALDHPGPAWWPILMLALTPMVTRSLAGNLLENTLLVLVLGAALATLRAQLARSATGAAGLAALAGLLLAGTVLTKAQAGLFVALWFILPWLLGLVPLGTQRVAMIIAVSFCTFCMVFLLLAQDPQAVRFAHDFVERKVVYARAFGGKFSFRPRAARLLVATWSIPLVLAGVTAGLDRLLNSGGPHQVGRREKRRACSPNWKPALLCILTALGGTLPYLGTGMPRRYMLPAYPFWVLGMAALSGPALNRLAARYTPAQLPGTLVWAAGALWFAAIAGFAAEWGRVRMHHDFFRDFSVSRTGVSLMVLPTRSTARPCPLGLAANWGLTANLQRHLHLSLALSGKARYVLTEGTACKVGDSCRPLLAVDRVRRYQLYDCDDSTRKKGHGK